MKFTLPKVYPSDVLTTTQVTLVASLLPEPKAETGRPAYTNEHLLPGILRVLRSGCRWRDLDLPNYPSGVTHWRRLQFWREHNVLGSVWCWLLTHLAKLKRIKLKTTSLDGSLVPSFAFSQTTGYSGRHHRTGVKVSSIVEENGLLLGAVMAPGNIHDLDLAVATIRKVRVGRRTRPGRVLADKGYDSRAFRDSLRARGIMANIPERVYGHRKKRGRPPKYSKRLGKKRYTVERTNAWWKSFRRLHFRFDRHIGSFEALFYLGAIVICVRRLVV